MKGSVRSSAHTLRYRRDAGEEYEERAMPLSGKLVRLAGRAIDWAALYAVILLLQALSG